MLPEMVRILIANDDSLCCSCETNDIRKCADCFLVVVIFNYGFMIEFFLTSIFVIVLGDVLVILDLRPDESLFEAGAAREVK